MNLTFSLKKLGVIALPIINPRFLSKASSINAALLISLLLVALYNISFFGAAIDVIHLTSARGLLFLANIALVLWLLTFIFITLLIVPYVGKPLLGILFIVAAGTAYFMDTYGMVIHKLMIQNVMETDFSEVQDLVNIKLILYIVVLGLVPALQLGRINIGFLGFKQELWKKVKFISIAFITSLLLILSMSADYASFFRNHKNIRQMANPLNVVYAASSYLSNSSKAVNVTPIENDAAINAFGKAQEKPILFILVVGETARADHFSINGYKQDTNPLISKQNIINFPNVISCGTETAVSVPCMFSSLGRSGYSDSKAKSQEGLLDVIKHAGIDVLWRDNNSSCKGTCDRVAYEDMQHLNLAGLCNEHECFDEILLHQLSDKLNSMNSKNKVIVLHQKGSHGPDYTQRYPENFTVFKPVCKTNQLQHCTREEVVNAFDNTIRYTDYFLNSTIEWLKTQTTKYNTALIYLSDHGESLGENGLYLHGMPYAIAPAEQKHVPFFFWLSDGFSQANAIDSQCLKNTGDQSFSQDNLFHTVLGLLNIQTHVYNSKLDMLKPCRTY
jgi:lipid A ethanolaminephosphotransferase